MASLTSDRSRESSLWKWLKAAADRLGRHADVQRIEDSTKRGTPDVEGCVRGGTFWCELKVAHRMANDRVRVRITVPQVRQARRRRRADGRAWVLVRLDGEGTKDRRHFLVDGLDAEELLEPVALTRLAGLSQAPIDAGSTELLETMAGVH